MRNKLALKLSIFLTIMLLIVFLPYLAIARNQINTSRLAGITRYDTAVEVSKFGWNESTNIIIARGDLFPDALAAAPLASKYKCPILLTNSDNLTTATRDEILRLKSSEVIILGSDQAIFPKVVTDIETQCQIPNSKIHRIGGEDRYQTASLIDTWLDRPGTHTAIIATGENYPDALAGAAIAAFKNIPIILVNTNFIYSSSQKVLQDLGINRTVILGGIDVIPEGIAKWLDENEYTSMRVAGDDRYETAQKIAAWAIDVNAQNPNIGMSSKTIFIATGENFPDALAAGPLAGKKGNPLLLVRKAFTPKVVYDWLDNQIVQNAILLGDEEAISPETEYGIKTGIRPPKPPVITSPKDGSRVSAVIDISGIVDTTATSIKLYINGIFVQEKSTGGSEKFNFSDMSLKEGANIIYVIARNGAGESEKSSDIVVSRGFSPKYLRWGKHIEVSLSQQMLYTFEDNYYVNSSPCTTGRKGYETRVGNFDIYSKERGVTLVGPQGVPPEQQYHLRVEYWMPFDGPNGLHDAWWRTYFGNPDTVAYDGSHGCINLPPSYAGWLWDWAPLHTPVDVY